jgi:hypothetical protein
VTRAPLTVRLLIASTVAVAALAAVAAPVRAQAPFRLAPTDAAYADLDRLAAGGLIDSAIAGQRGLSRSEVALLVARARASAAQPGPRGVNAATAEALERMEARVHRDLAAERSARPIDAGVDGVDLTLAHSGSAPRMVPADTGLGGVDATIDPLTLTGRQGRDELRGSSIGIEAGIWFRMGSHLAVEARPRFRAGTEPSVLREPTVSWQSLVGRFQAGNVVFSIGREYLTWGTARHGGLFLSDNAPPLDLISIASDRPFSLPGPLGRLGPTRAIVFGSDLGARQFFPHSMLLGYKVSVAPAPRLELGVSVLDFTGGEGAPRATALKRVEHFLAFPVLPLKGFQFSNQMAGIDLRYRMAGRRGATVYWEMNLDDFDVRRLDGVLWRDDAAQLVGVRVPAITPDGRVGVTAEIHHTGTRFGRHLQFQSGATRDGRLLGDPLGPDADGAYAFVDLDPGPRTHVSVAVAAEAYRADQYVIASQDPFVIRRTGSRPQERRTRAVLSWRRQSAGARAWFELQGGLERVAQFAFSEGPARTSGMAAAVLHWSLR